MTSLLCQRCRDALRRASLLLLNHGCQNLLLSCGVDRLLH
jgi:hypothetical protein